jgi:hypothetical protein
LRVAVVGFAVREASVEGVAKSPSVIGCEPELEIGEVLRCIVGRADRQVERELATVTNTSRMSDPVAKITKTQT